MESHQQQDSAASFWTLPETVDTFANREPDQRLVKLLGEYSEPQRIRVLDLGCAGGRNTVKLAEDGFNFDALDESEPMITKTRERITSLLGVTAAQRQVQLGKMDNLSAFPDSCFDLIVALGIYHQTSSLEQWHKTVGESGRVLKGEGLVLISGFTPQSEPDGEPLAPVQDNREMYEGFSSGPLCLMNIEDHDRRMAAHGFEPEVPTETVRVKTELGYRTTLNALYRKCEVRSS